MWVEWVEEEEDVASLLVARGFEEELDELKELDMLVDGDSEEERLRVTRCLLVSFPDEDEADRFRLCEFEEVAFVVRACRDSGTYAVYVPLLEEYLKRQKSTSLRSFGA